MKSGIISADIVGSTSVDAKAKLKLLDALKLSLFPRMRKRFDTFHRVTKGDTIEVYVPKPADTLRAALILKTFIKGQAHAKAIVAKLNKKSTIRSQYFKAYGIRMAVVVDEMTLVDKKNNVLEGEAIYKAGRTLADHHTYDKERIVIKNSIFFHSGTLAWEGEFQVVLGLIDTLLLKTTARQCEMLCERFFGVQEQAIADKFQISQSAVNQGLKSSGWSAMEKAVLRFEQVVNVVSKK